MARYIGPKRRLSRREGVSLYDNKKTSYDLRPYPPGEHGSSRRTKLSNYGIQLREKQKVKRLYGILERQFRGYYQKAAASEGVTGTILLQFLERRLDNVVFRLGLAVTREQGRQFVSHGFIYVDGQRVNIPSFLVKEGQKIELRAKKESTKKYIEDNLETTKERKVPSWIKADVKKLSAEIVGMPARDDVQFPINEQLIVELYSK